MEYDAFMSYSSGDNAIAMRIYNDLVRSGLKVWRYDKDGIIGANFIDEIYEKIQNSNSFVLIDSNRARKSDYVKKECEIGHNLYVDQNGCINKLIICLVEDERKTFKEKELFYSHNRIRYINLSGYDYWDNREIYIKAIQLLCTEFNKEFKPSLLSIPSYRDFEKELASTKISFPPTKGENISEKEIILNEFRNFLYRYQQNDSYSKTRIKGIINTLESLEIKLTTPYLTLGIIQSDLYEFEEALITFEQVTKYFPDDPRGFSSSSAMLYKLEKYDEALEINIKAVEISKLHRNNQYVQDHYIELVYNKIYILLKTGRYRDAHNEIKLLSEEQKEMPEMRIAQILIYILQGDLSNAKKDYDQLQKFYNPKMVDQNTSELNQILSDLESHLGRLFARSENYDEAIKHLINSSIYCLECIRCKAELAQVYHAEQRTREKAQIIEEGLKLSPRSDTELYFYGLLHYLNENHHEAVKYFNLSKMDLKGWEYYEALII